MLLLNSVQFIPFCSIACRNLLGPITGSTTDMRGEVGVGTLLTIQLR